MAYRNAIFTKTGLIDCEINHPVYGWIPFTASPDDVEKHGRNLYTTALATGGIAAYVAPPLPTEAERLARQRAGMACTKMQGILTLGETKWGEVLAYRNQEFVEATSTEPEVPATTWPEKMIIDSAQSWDRTSENIAFFGQLLKYDDLQMDALFIAAADVVT